MIAPQNIRIEVDDTNFRLRDEETSEKNTAAEATAFIARYMPCNQRDNGMALSIQLTEYFNDLFETALERGFSPCRLETR